MTYEQVHKFLKVKQREMTQNRHLYNETAVAINDKAIEAVEKQIPKKPESDYVEFFAEGNNVRRKWYYTCPACGNELKPDHNYCNCGQKILWEDKNGNAAD